MRRLILSLPLFAAHAAAQPATADTTLPEVSVVATRIATDASRAPSRITILDPDDVRVTGASSVADLLEWRAPTQVRRYGPGGTATLSVRGAGAGQTSVLLDGHALSDPQLGMVDLALLPSLLVGRLELLHGAGSALHGAGAIGGVVSVSTPTATEPAVTLSTRAGAWDEWGVDGIASVRAGRLGVLVAASGTAARDDYPYFDPNAGVSGSTVRRAGADRALAALFARVATEGPTRASAAVWAGTAERGAPGAAGTAPDQGGRQWDRHIRAWTNVTVPAGVGSLTAGVLLQRTTLRYTGAASDDTGRTWLASSDAQLNLSMSMWTVVAGVGGAYASADHPSLAGGSRDGRISGWTAASGSVGRVNLFPALRADAYLRTSDVLAALSPRLGASLLATPAVTLKSSAGLAFRPPTFNDRYWQYAGEPTPAGDPDLDPERGWTVDGGVRAQRGPAVAEVTAYVAGTHDQIVWLPSESGLYTPRNLARTVARGVELTLDVEPARTGPARTGAGASYVLTDARDRSDPASVAFNRPLRYVARHAMAGHAFVATNGEGTGIRLDLQGRVLGPRPTRADGGAKLPSHVVADARLSLRRQMGAAGLEVVIAIENVTDSRYSVVEGYPMPPRHASLTLRLSI